MKQDLKKAVHAAIAGGWRKAHEIAQDSADPAAHWIHAVLHKMEPDEGNSRYWYARAGRRYEDYADPQAELQAIVHHLDGE